MKNFQKKLTKTTTTAQFLPFFPFFLSMFQQKNKTQIPASSESVDK